MDDTLDPEIFREYLAEVFESLEGLDEKFVALEKSPDDTKIIDSIFRPVHSIKGSSAFFGLNHVKNFAHTLENLLDDLRKGKKGVSQRVIDNLLKGTDYLKEMFQREEAGGARDMTQEEADFIGTLEERIAAGEEGQTKDGLDSCFSKMEAILEEFKKTEHGNSELISELEQNLIMARALSTSPDGSADSVPKVQKLGEIMVDKEKVSPKQVDDAIQEQKPEEKIGEVLVKKGVVSEKIVNDAIDIQKKQSREAEKAKLTVQKTMRIAEQKVDEFMNQVGELVIISEVFNYLERRLSSLTGAEAVTKEFKNVNISFSELTFRLQQGLSEVRKVSIKSLFQKIPRLVRDLSASLGKSVEIRIEGEEIMVDKSLLEKFESPLIHMVRNAVDHGAEMPDARTAKGKSKSSNIFLSAEIKGEMLTIRLEDDGGGLSREKIIEKAVSKGLTTMQTAESMSDSEVFDFILCAGFSTAKKVTDVSGRGVGMDVVKSALTEMKGKIEINSVYDKGSTFIITLPVSTILITINGLVLKVGKGKFILPVEDVKESFRPEQSDLFTIKERSEMVNIRGEIYPLVRLYRNFNIKTVVMDPRDGVGIIIQKNGRRYCIMADSIVEQQDVVLKDLGDIFRNVKSIKGGAILGDGSIGLVLNVEGLMEAE